MQRFSCTDESNAKVVSGCEEIKQLKCVDCTFKNKEIDLLCFFDLVSSNRLLPYSTLLFCAQDSSKASKNIQ